MADKNDTQELSAEEIAETAQEAVQAEEEAPAADIQDTAEEYSTEIENPFEQDEHKKEKKKKEKHRKKEKTPEDADADEKEAHSFLKSLKKIFLTLLVLGAFVLIILGVAIIMHRRNDGARFARELAEQISRPISDAQSSAGITLKAGSDNPTLNLVFQEHINMTESKKNCKVMGVQLPQWAIVCHTQGDLLHTVTFYDYTTLAKNPLGTPKKSYIEPATVTGPLTDEQVSEQLGLKPYSVTYYEDQSVVRTYRYCYKDAESGGLVSYTIEAEWNMAGELRKIDNTRTNYVSLLLGDEAV